MVSLFPSLFREIHLNHLLIVPSHQLEIKMILLSLGLGLAFIEAVSAQYFPPKPEGVTTLKSKFHEGVTISYKEVGYCESI